MSEHFFPGKASDTGLRAEKNGGAEQEPEPAGEAEEAGPSDRERSRIAQTGKKILDQAKRALPLSEKPVFRPRRHKSKPPPKHGLAATLSESEQAQLVEVVDSEDRPLMCMPPETALRQKLALRIVAVALRTRGDRLILHKRRELRLPSLGKWDLYTGFVRVGEAREDAALRLLLSGARVSGIRLSPLPKGENRIIGSHLLTVFTADLPAGLYPQHPDQELLTVDADELAGLMRDVPELLSPELSYAASIPGILKMDY